MSLRDFYKVRDDEYEYYSEYDDEGDSQQGSDDFMDHEARSDGSWNRGKGKTALRNKRELYATQLKKVLQSREPKNAASTHQTASNTIEDLNTHSQIS